MHVTWPWCFFLLFFSITPIRRHQGQFLCELCFHCGLFPVSFLCTFKCSHLKLSRWVVSIVYMIFSLWKTLRCLLSTTVCLRCWRDSWGMLEWKDGRFSNSHRRECADGVCVSCELGVGMRLAITNDTNWVEYGTRCRVSSEPWNDISIFILTAVLKSVFSPSVSTVTLLSRSVIMENEAANKLSAPV